MMGGGSMKDPNAALESSNDDHPPCHQENPAGGRPFLIVAYPCKCPETYNTSQHRSYIQCHGTTSGVQHLCTNHHSGIVACTRDT